MHMQGESVLLFLQLNNVQAELQKIYSSGKVCNITNHKCLKMEPGLTSLLAKSRDYGELAAAWKGWRDATGKKMKDLYAEFVELRNEGARISGSKYYYAQIC